MSIRKVSSIIDGKELGCGGGGTYEVINPATGEVIAEELLCDSADVGRIVEASEKAYRSDAWQLLPAAARGEMLLRLATLVEENAEELVELELLDTGKPISQLRAGEIPLMAAIIRFYAGAADKVEGSVKSGAPGELLLQMYEPYGVVGGILPWNYPLVNAGLKVPPAIAAGNTIVLKPSVETPLATVAFAKLCTEAGIPPNIVNVVTGRGSDAGNALVAHPAVGKISFTGSTAVGQAVQRLGTERMKMVNLECGGKNAVIVFADADLNRAAEAALISAFVNCGQLCVACSRALVEESVAEEFEALLEAKLDTLKVGDPRAEDTLVGPMITRDQYETALDYMRIAEGECTVRYGGAKLEVATPLQNGLWLQPTLLSGVKPGMRVHDEEIFGPVLSIVRFRDEADAIDISNCVEYGLSGSVWTRDGSRGLRVAKALDTGIIWVNTMLTGYPQIPVPPHKMSGTGVELGMEGMLAYMKRKSVIIGHDDSAAVGWSLS